MVQRGISESDSRMVQGAAELDIDTATVATLRERLPSLAEEVITAVIDEVPSYADALSGRMGTKIRVAVQGALGVFLDLVGAAREPEMSLGQGREAVYELGRGEARSGRSMDALLAAYRVGARVSWRTFADIAVASGMRSDTVAKFAEVVFAFIDELSATSAAGHADELETTGRVRERYLTQLAQDLLAGADDERLHAAAEHADWPVPDTLTAVLLPSARMHNFRQLLHPATLLLTEDVAELPGDHAVLFVPDAHGRGRSHLLRQLRGSDATVGPARPWQHVGASFRRALRAAQLTGTSPEPVDTEEYLVELIVTADPEALRDLRERALAPLQPVRPAVAARLRETLASWLRHHGRRDEVAAELFVHPQTVRYRMGRLRELFGDALTDPRRVLELTLALAVPAGGEPEG